MFRPLAVGVLTGMLVTSGALVTGATAMSGPHQDSLVAGKPGAAMLGTWKGTVRDDGGAVHPYHVTVKITRSKKTHLPQATVTYPYCTGHWTYVKKQSPWQVFTETITRDPGIQNCVPKLKVKVKKIQGGDLQVKWFFHKRHCHMRARKVDQSS